MYFCGFIHHTDQYFIILIYIYALFLAKIFLLKMLKLQKVERGLAFVKTF